MKKILVLFTILMLYATTQCGKDYDKKKFPTQQALLTFIRAEIEAMELNVNDINQLKSDAQKIADDLQREQRCKKLLSYKKNILKKINCYKKN